jgi:hypothetical protein
VRRDSAAETQAETQAETLYVIHRERYSTPKHRTATGFGGGVFGVGGREYSLLDVS